jgi:hypothetical protein
MFAQQLGQLGTDHHCTAPAPFRRWIANEATFHLNHRLTNPNPLGWEVNIADHHSCHL